MQKSLAKRVLPAAIVMIQVRTPADYIAAAQKAADEGADALGAQLERIPRELRTDKALREMFACTDLPVYATDYAGDCNAGVSDDALAEDLLRALDAGATLHDVPGDMFHTEKYQLTADAAAVDKQMRLIGRIRERGGEALMSSHIFEFRACDDMLAVAREQARRGADVLKFVTASNSAAELADNLKTTVCLRASLDRPFVFLSCGAFCRPHRLLGPYFGAGYWLCAAQHGALDTPEQPLLSELAAFRAAYPACGSGTAGTGKEGTTPL